MANTTASIQAYLNSLSQLPGSLLYRNTLDWTALPPGDENDVLTLDQALLPTWQPLQRYFPASWQYNGAGTYFSKTNLNLTNNGFTLVHRFTDHPTGVNKTSIYLFVPGITWCRAWITSVGLLQIECKNAANAFCVQLQSTLAYNDDLPHTCFFQYDPTAGTAVFIVDGQDADDTTWTGRTLTTATLPASALGQFHTGRSAAGAQQWIGTIGYIGFKQSLFPSWFDFMTPTGLPKQLDITTWNEWGSKPLVWHESGQLAVNRGSTGNFTNNGGTTIALPEYWGPN